VDLENRWRTSLLSTPLTDRENETDINRTPNSTMDRFAISLRPQVLLTIRDNRIARGKTEIQILSLIKDTVEPKHGHAFIG